MEAMSPRNSVLETRRTRERILDRAMAIGSVEGLEGLSIGRLAAELGMSKAGILGHFGTKQSLQLAVIDAAAQMFIEEVPGRVPDAAPGLAQLRALCTAWVSYLERRVLPGGCFFTAAAAEFDGREGPVRDAIADLNARWQRTLRWHIQQATRNGQLPPDTDPDQLVYEIYGVMLTLNQFLQLHHDQTAPSRARRALQRLI
jgi:AcrR family transcriptional regulator